MGAKCYGRLFLRKSHCVQVMEVISPSKEVFFGRKRVMHKLSALCQSVLTNNDQCFSLLSLQNTQSRLLHPFPLYSVTPMRTAHPRRSCAQHAQKGNNRRHQRSCGDIVNDDNCCSYYAKASLGRKGRRTATAVTAAGAATTTTTTTTAAAAASLGRTAPPPRAADLFVSPSTYLFQEPQSAKCGRRRVTPSDFGAYAVDSRTCNRSSPLRLTDSGRYLTGETCPSNRSSNPQESTPFLSQNDIVVSHNIYEMIPGSAEEAVTSFVDSEEDDDTKSNSALDR